METFRRLETLSWKCWSLASQFPSNLWLTKSKWQRLDQCFELTLTFQEQSSSSIRTSSYQVSQIIWRFTVILYVRFATRRGVQAHAHHSHLWERPCEIQARGGVEKSKGLLRWDQKRHNLLLHYRFTDTRYAILRIPNGQREANENQRGSGKIKDAAHESCSRKKRSKHRGWEGFSRSRGRLKENVLTHSCYLFIKITYRCIAKN